VVDPERSDPAVGADDELTCRAGVAVKRQARKRTAARDTALSM
jgi:hypothetical protein